MPSERQKKRAIAEGVRALRDRPGWDPRRFQAESRTERVKRSLEDARVSEALSDADQCPACKELRDQGDAGALCQEHLREAMGLGTAVTGK